MIGAGGLAGIAPGAKPASAVLDRMMNKLVWKRRRCMIVSCFPSRFADGVHNEKGGEGCFISWHAGSKMDTRTN